MVPTHVLPRVIRRPQRIRHVYENLSLAVCGCVRKGLFALMNGETSVNEGLNVHGVVTQQGSRRRERTRIVIPRW